MCVFIVLAMQLLILVILEPFAQGCSVRRHCTQSTSNYIAKSDRDQVLGKHLANRDLSTTEHTEWNDEHVCDRVIQS